MESPEGERNSLTPRSRSRSRSRLESPANSPPHRRAASQSRSPQPRRRSFSRSRSRTPRRHRSRSGSPRNGHDGSRRSRRTRSPQSRSPMSNRRRHIGTRDNPEPSKCLGVFGLSVYTTERELHSIFDKFGPLEKVQVVLDSKTGKSRGFAFVYFESIKDAAEAKDECSGMEIDGRRIRVDFSITKRPHTPTPGIYMGRPTTRGGYDRGYGGRGGGGYRGDRYRSPSPRYRQRSSGGRRDYYDRGYDRGDRSYYRGGGGYDRYDRQQHYDRYDRYDRAYDKYERYERSRSRSYSPRESHANSRGAGARR
ncbi:transformer-2 protein homolog alpha-like isoform X6 [Homarus americanus]|uniref:Transformer-2 protein beta-like n=1 Tax=Homarus americanus TaxID=6706 RepID=A0A8J5N3H0_HOMAM|nr:transformer-2 protein homolog alpha-like isoform X6 [Homarus americanus]KAG7172586.1 Transformer-2 protein beta-like [Homarus americanus]